MKSPVRLNGLALFAGILALISLVYILFADYFIAGSIRNAGSQVVGAKVELESANLSLSEEKLALNKLAITNPKNPMTNALQLDYLELDMDASALAWNKIIVDTIKVTNLFLNTPRETSGELSNYWLDDVSEWQPLAGIAALDSMSADNLPNPKDIIAQEKLETLTAVDDFKRSLNDAETELNKRLTSLPDETKIKSYQDRFKKLKGDDGGNKLLNILSKGKDFKALRQELKADLDGIKEFKSSLQTQRKSLSTELNNLRSMPKKDLARLKAKYSLSGDGVANLVTTVFGPQIGNWVREGYGYYELVQPYLSQIKPSENSDVHTSTVITNRGRKVLFDDQNPLPNYLIKAIDVVSPDNRGHLSVSGKINNLTTEPHRWSEPLDMQLTGTAPFIKAFALKGLFDHRDLAKSRDTITLGITDLDLKTTFAESAAELPVKATAGNVDINADINLNNNQLDAKIRLNFKQIALEVLEAEPWVKTIATGLSQMPQFEVVISLGGDINTPTTAISSPDLSKLAQQVMQSLLSEELQGFENKLMEQIQQATKEPLSNIPGLDSLDAIQKQLNIKELDLNNLLKNLG